MISSISNQCRKKHLKVWMSHEKIFLIKTHQFEVSDLSKEMHENITVGFQPQNKYIHKW